MNSVVSVILCIASLILMVVFAFLWYFETRRRDIIETCLGASLAEVTHLQTLNADLSDALQDARAEIKALDMRTVEMPHGA